MAIALIEDEALYLRIFADQSGYGMPRYRGSPLTGGSFWGRLVSFAKGMFRTAAPHVSSLLSKAHPHVKGMASKAVESAIDSAVEHVTEKLRKTQEGSGRKRIKGRKAKKSKPTKRKKITKRKTIARRLSIESEDNF